VKFTITIDLKDVEMPAKRKRIKKHKPVGEEASMPEGERYKYNDKVWNSDIRPEFYEER
jgi:hypothetical protein